MQTLSHHDLQSVAGGHGAPSLSTVGFVLFLVELPHMAHGIIEFYNFSHDWAERGCSDLNHDEYFKRHTCMLTQHAKTKGSQFMTWFKGAETSAVA